VDILNHLAQAAAVILLVELLVILLVFLGISGGLAFGLRWVGGKTDWAFDKVNGYVAMGTRYVHTATDYAAKPLIAVSGFTETVKDTAEAIRQQIRQARSPVVGAEPAVSSAVTEPVLGVPASAATVEEKTEEIAAQPTP
jgi:hypothetical protein